MHLCVYVCAHAPTQYAYASEVLQPGEREDFPSPGENCVGMVNGRHDGQTHQPCRKNASREQRREIAGREKRGKGISASFTTAATETASWRDPDEENEIPLANKTANIVTILSSHHLDEGISF